MVIQLEGRISGRGLLRNQVFGAIVTVSWSCPNHAPHQEKLLLAMI